MNARAMTLVLLLSLAALAPPLASGAAADQPFSPAQLKTFPRGQMTIERAQGRDNFQVWIADSPERHEQGLMWLRQLPPDYGMVFVLENSRPMTMWMKNTYVPLDMLFFDAEGRIVSITSNTKPLSTTIIDSGGPVAGVVELLGGEAARRGIATGDRIKYSATPR
jgi:uncharacterized protein